MKTFTKHSQDGFTVTEMVVVLAIISILTIIALTTFTKIKDKAKVNVVKNNINTIDNALKTYAQKHQGLFPGFTEWPVNLPYGVDGRVKGNRIIGGNGGPVDKRQNLETGEIYSTTESLLKQNQDDFLADLKQPRSPFRDVLPQRYTSFAVRMKPPDALYAENLLVPYPDNPLKPPGQGMINVAYTLGTYHKNINTFSLLPITDSYSPSPIGLAPGYPNINNVTWRYSIYANMWDHYTNNPVNQWNYPSGEFAYIPLGLSDPSGEYATAYWLIGYGDEDTLKNSPYNRLLDNPNFPNFPPPMGDGNPTTPPIPGSYEFSVRQFVKGALVIKASKYENQLVIDRY